jgi:hypothetical protein
MSGIGNSRSSVLLGPVRTAASTFSDTLAFLLGPSLRTLAGGNPAVHVLLYLKHDPEKWIPVFGKDHAQTTS